MSTDQVDFLRAKAKVAACRRIDGTDLQALLVHGSLALSEREANAFLRGGYETFARIFASTRGAK